MASLPLVGQDFAGYRLLGVLGRGGMSVVFEAENARLGSKVALKVIAPELAADDAFRARFLKESRLAASLNHPNVIPIYDTGAHEDLLYIVMRHVAGSDLRTLLSKQGRISPGQALMMVGQASRALDAAHRHGLVHRDVKPANVLIERGADGDPDHVYLSDFGLTKHQLSRSGLTETGQLLGTIDYIAPEQIQGKDVDGSADIYSLGCVLYECITGRVPFVKDLDAAVIWAHVEEPPTPPSAVQPELPRGIDDVILRALAKDPADRYPTCREFVAAASGALEPDAQPSRPQLSDLGIAAGPPTVLSGESARELEPEAARPATVQPASAGSAAASGAGWLQAPPTPLQAGAEPPSAAPLADSAPAASLGAASGPPSLPQGPPPSGGEGRRRRRPWYALALAGLIGVAVAVVLLSSTSSKSTNTGELSSAHLGPVPTNHVTGNGNASVTLEGDKATFTVTTAGLDNNDALAHLMHIHAGGKGECPPAAAARLHNGHLTISTTDGINYYGAPIIALTTAGDFSPSSILTFPRFLTGGTLHYRRTMTIPASAAEAIRKNNAVMVVHGIDYDGTGIYSGILERSELNKTVPATATAPALCGPLVAKTHVATLHGGSRARRLVFTASLAASSVPSSEWFLCGGETAVPVAPTRRQLGAAT